MYTVTQEVRSPKHKGKMSMGSECKPWVRSVTKIKFVADSRTDYEWETVRQILTK